MWLPVVSLSPLVLQHCEVALALQNLCRDLDSGLDRPTGDVRRKEEELLLDFLVGPCRALRNFELFHNHQQREECLSGRSEARHENSKWYQNDATAQNSRRNGRKRCTV